MRPKYLLSFLLLLLPLLAISSTDASQETASDLSGDTLQSRKWGDLGWPEYRIPYFITDRRAERLGHWAARTRNRSGARYRFVPVQKRSEAKVLISKYRTCGAGLANIGYLSEEPSRAWISVCSSSFDRAIATHELGHILGLWHYGKCQLMSPSLCRGISPRPGKKEKRLLRKMAANRDRAVRLAPAEPSIRIIKKTVDYDEEDVLIDLTVRMSASFRDRFWEIPEITLLSSDSTLEAYCDTDNTEWPDGEYGPWGWSGAWKIDDYVSCYITEPAGKYTVVVSARSQKGTRVEDRYTFTAEQ